MHTIIGNVSGIHRSTSGGEGVGYTCGSLCDAYNVLPVAAIVQYCKTLRGVAERWCQPHNPSIPQPSALPPPVHPYPAILYGKVDFWNHLN